MSFLRPRRHRSRTLPDIRPSNRHSSSNSCATARLRGIARNRCRGTRARSCAAAASFSRGGASLLFESFSRARALHIKRPTQRRYTGSGKKVAEGAPVEQDACKKEACAIQWCLARRNHQEKYCKDYIVAWKECCDKARGNEAARLAAATEAPATRVAAEAPEAPAR